MAQVSGENKMNNAEGNYLQPEILCYNKDIFGVCYFHSSANAELQNQTMLDNLFKNLPCKIQNKRVDYHKYSTNPFS